MGAVSQSENADRTAEGTELFDDSGNQFGTASLIVEFPANRQGTHFIKVVAEITEGKTAGEFTADLPYPEVFQFIQKMI